MKRLIGTTLGAFLTFKRFDRKQALGVFTALLMSVGFLNVPDTAARAADSSLRVSESYVNFLEYSGLGQLPASSNRNLSYTGDYAYDYSAPTGAGLFSPDRTLVGWTSTTPSTAGFYGEDSGQVVFSSFYDSPNYPLGPSAYSTSNGTQVISTNLGVDQINAAASVWISNGTAVGGYKKAFYYGDSNVSNGTTREFWLMVKAGDNALTQFLKVRLVKSAPSTITLSVIQAASARAGVTRFQDRSIALGQQYDQVWAWNPGLSTSTPLTIAASATNGQVGLASFSLVASTYTKKYFVNGRASLSLTEYPLWSSTGKSTVTWLLSGGAGANSLNALPDGSYGNSYTNDGTVPYSIYNSRDYTFTGWDVVNGIGTDTGNIVLAHLNPGDRVFADGRTYKLIATWVPLTTSINFDGNGATAGTVPASLTVNQGSDIRDLNGNPGLSKNGATFIGWNTSADGQGVWAKWAGKRDGTWTWGGWRASDRTASITFYAQYAMPGTGVVVYGNGATSGFSPTQLAYAANAQIAIGDLSSYTKVGYEPRSGAELFDPTTGLAVALGQSFNVGTTSRPIAVNWAPKSYDVRFHFQDGTTPDVVAKTVDDRIVGVPLRSFRLGYEGSPYWYDSPLGGNSGLKYGFNTPNYGEINSTTFDYAFTSNLDLYIHWTLSGNRFKFISKNDPLVWSRYVDCFSPIVLPTRPAASASYGYFLGWNTAADGTGTHYSPGQIVSMPCTFAMGWTSTAEISLYAEWSSKLAVNFLSGGAFGTPPASMSLDGNYTFALPSTTLYLDNYDFVGWSDGTQVLQPGASYTTGSSNITFTATWTVAAFPIAETVKFNANSATSGTVPNGWTSVAGTTRKVPANTGSLERTGYTFAGWGTEPGSSGTILSPGTDYVVPSGTTTLFAKWAPTSHIARFYAGLGTGSLPSTSVLFTGDSLIMPGSGLTRSGYTFSGWSDGASNYAVGSTYTIDAQDVNFTATWIGDIHTISFGADGGIGTAPSALSGRTGSTATLPANPFTRSGWSFAGWFVDAIYYQVVVGGNSSGTFMPYVPTLYQPGAAFTFDSSDVTLLPAWVGLPATVTYSANGGIGPLPASEISTNVGANIMLTSQGALARAGYDFGGWNTLADGSGNNYPASTGFSVPTTAVTLYAKWIPRQITATYVSNGATVSTASVLVGNQLVTAPTAPARLGYTFQGWFASAQGGTALTFPYTVEQTANFTLYAQWVGNPARVIFHGGSGVTGIAPETINGVTGGQFVIPGAGTLQKIGYSFYGWQSSSGQVYGPGGIFALLPGDNSYTAYWTADAATVVFDPNGAASGSAPIASGSITGETITLPDSGNLAKPGYSFVGWNTLADGSGAFFSIASSYSVPPGTTSLYAVWRGDQSTVTYWANDGGASANYIENPMHSVGESLTLPSSLDVEGFGSFVNQGFIFRAWSTNPDGTGSIFEPGSVVEIPSVGLNLYAQWSRKVNFNSNGATEGTPVSPLWVSASAVSVNVGGQGGLLRSGYSFVGWNTKADGTGNFVSGNMTPNSFDFSPSGQATLFAIWYPGFYTLTLNQNPGLPFGTVHRTDDVFKLSDLLQPQLMGYVFAGWNTAADGTGNTYSSTDDFVMPPNDLTLYGQWIPVSISVTYDLNGGVGITPTQSDVNFGSIVQLADDSNFSKPGYLFKDWRDGSSWTYIPGESYLVGASNVTFTAYWSPTCQIVTYLGGLDTTGTAPTQDLICTGDSFALAANSFTKTGYTFAGWNDGTTTYAAGASYTMGAANVTLTAQWTANSATVTYGANGSTSGSAPSATVSVTDGSITLPANSGVLAKTGYIFTGWNTLADGSGTHYAVGGSYTVPAGGVTLYAEWTATSQTVTYAGGSGATGTAPTQGGVATGGSFALAANSFTKTGYTFAGWNDGTTTYAAGASYTMGAANVTLTAQWTAEVVAPPVAPVTPVTPVTPVSSGAATGSGTSVDPYVPVYAPVAPVTSVTPSSGSVAVVGGVTQTVSSQVSEAKDALVVSVGSVVVSAKPVANGSSTGVADPKVLTVTDSSYIQLSGSGLTPNSVLVVYMFSTPVKLGTILVGADGSYSGAIVIPAGVEVGSHTLQIAAIDRSSKLNVVSMPLVVAKSIRVTFDSLGGSDVAPVTVAEGNAVVEPVQPVRVGANTKFLGWFTKPVGGQKISFPYVVGGGLDVTLYAQWGAGFSTSFVAYFTYNSSTLSKVYKEKLKAFISPLRYAPSMILTVTGYSDKTHAAVALARAKVLVAYLKTLKIQASYRLNVGVDNGSSFRARRVTVSAVLAAH